MALLLVSEQADHAFYQELVAGTNTLLRWIQYALFPVSGLLLWRAFPSRSTAPLVLDSAPLSRRGTFVMTVFGITVLLWLTVIGVAANVRYRDLTTSLTDPGEDPDVYFSYQQLPAGSFDILVKTTGAPTALTGSLRSVVAALDPATPLYDVASMPDELAAQMALGRMISAFLAVRRQGHILRPIDGLVEDRAQDEHDEIDHEGYGRAVAQAAVFVEAGVNVDGDRFGGVEGAAPVAGEVVYRRQPG